MVTRSIGAVVGLQFANMASKILAMKRGALVVKFLKLDLKAVERWPRVRPHWRRFRRRLCDNCPACAHLTEPRYMVCSGCGVARYCSEECQRAHWPLHQKDCLMYQEGLAKARLDREPLFRKLSLDLPEGEEFEK